MNAATPSPLGFARIDPADEEVVAHWFALRTAAARADLPAHPAPCHADLLGSLRVAPPATAVEEWAARDGGRLVGTLRMEYPTEENTGAATAETLVVHPHERGRGIGRALHAFAVEQARSHDRGRLVATTDEALQGPSAAGRFAAAVGASRVATLDHYQLALEESGAEDRARILETARTRAAGYELTQWHTTVPDELLRDAAALQATLSESAPTGALEWEPQPADTARIRDFETMRIARGRRAYQTGVLDTRTGRLVAWSALSMTGGNPDSALQAVTVVHPAHRGRALGTVVKLANLDHIRREEPRLRSIDTWNAQDNVHMVRINRELGFRPVDRRVIWQQEL